MDWLPAGMREIALNVGPLALFLVFVVGLKAAIGFMLRRDREAVRRGREAARREKGQA
jgi:hypothetical protein